jgi:ABC-type multidrug transport system ATPase subunit
MKHLSTRSQNFHKEGCDVQIKNVTIFVSHPRWKKLFGFQTKDKGPMYILQPLSAFIEKSSLFAILGGSGSGKTSLLNVIADRYDKSSLHVDGTIEFGNPSSVVGYVTQNDYLLPSLTIKETLLFTAKLKINRLYSSLEQSNAALEDIVNDVIMDLGLKECINNRIGDHDMTGSQRGISGGEKRRVSVALQIISNPQGN